MTSLASRGWLSFRTQGGIVYGAVGFLPWVEMTNVQLPDDLHCVIRQLGVCRT